MQSGLEPSRRKIVMRLQPRSIARQCLIIAALAVTSTGAFAQTNTQVGARLGYNFHSDDAVLGLNLTVPISTAIEFYPSIDLYIPDSGNQIGFNGDVKVVLPLRLGPNLYGGGGIGLVNRNEGTFANTDVGINLLFGIESLVGWIHPFGEARLMIYDDPQFALFGGVNFRFGGGR